MVSHSYTRKHNEVIKCIHILLCNKYNLKQTRKLRSYSVQEILAKKEVEVRFDTITHTDIKLQNN